MGRRAPRLRSRTRVAQLRIEHGFVQDELAALLGISVPRYSGIENATLDVPWRWPTVEQAQALSGHFGKDVSDLWPFLTIGPCPSERHRCSELTFNGRECRNRLGSEALVCDGCGEPLDYRRPARIGERNWHRQCYVRAQRGRPDLASVRYVQPIVELEAYKREHGLRGSKEAAKEIGCAVSTLRRWVHDGRLVAPAGVVGVIPVLRYPGPWVGERPLLFPNEAIEPGRQLLAEAYAQRGERMAEKWADGRITGRPRQGVEQPCACGCGRAAYRTLGQLADGREQVFYSATCRNRYRWRHGIGVRELVESWWHAGRARQIWLGRWGGRKPPAPGSRPRGCPPVTVTEQQRRQIALASRRWGRRKIASEFGLSEWAVRCVLDELPGSDTA